MSLFVGACAVPDGGLFRAARFRDVHLYQRYTEALLNGHVPYRDFFMEYPPGAFAVFLPPAAATHSHYNAAFKALMALCGAVALVLVALVLVRLQASVARVWIAVLLVAASPVALGPISLNTYDAWPALLTVAALALLLARREVIALAVLGLAFAAKVYPVVLLPVALVWTWRTRGRRTVLAAAGAFAAAALVVVLPFLVLAPHGLVESFRAQAARGLQIESLGAQLLVAADHLGLYSVTVAHHTRGVVTYDVRGSLPQALGALSSALQVVAVLGVAWLYGRGRDDGRGLVAAFAAAVAGFLAFTRFFSPQYLVWLVPLVPLLDGAAAWCLLATALALDQVWFFHYRSIVELGGRSWFVLARDLLVVALFVVVLRRESAEDEHAVVLEDELPLGVPS
ncbi:MAG: DUF2029 domain-containing protein [Actinobacteria bacterium]|nr:MAG: DUF2029 domain-containing protein [Actinomycetota bacterium]